MTTPPVLLQIDGNIARVTLNRPEAGNAIDLALARTLAEVAERCARDPTVRCVVLTGAGRLFCAGGDLPSFIAAGNLAASMLDELARTLNEALVHFATMAKPLLTLVNGPAAGAGLSLAIFGDVVLCADTAHFTAAYGALGLTPDGGMSWSLPRLVGLRKAQEMILTNRRIGAVEAEATGLVTRTVTPERLDEEGRAVALQLATGATGAIGATRELLRESFAGSLETQLDRELKAIVTAGASSDFLARITAIGERRTSTSDT